MAVAEKPFSTFEVLPATYTQRWVLKKEVQLIRNNVQLTNDLTINISMMAAILSLENNISMAYILLCVLINFIKQPFGVKKRISMGLKR